MATKSEGVGLVVRVISFQDFQPMWSQSTNFTDGQTDGRHAIPIPRICTKVHCAVKRCVVCLSVCRQWPAERLGRSTWHRDSCWPKECFSQGKGHLSAERVINVSNCLPPSVDYSTLLLFWRSIDVVDFTFFLKCDTDWMSICCIYAIIGQLWLVPCCPAHHISHVLLWIYLSKLNVCMYQVCHSPVMIKFPDFSRHFKGTFTDYWPSQQ